ncbi:hypothetical protein OBBRIDRAFT_558865 [Obba rivulosa]|uniref:Uncharacterized protein n=1 Tax=Obba rivulosa TaxID=1052685 RepID=A0A8E2DKY2_9APHY|nr:hypothetical protein OBBRIDRAFT_558865 [Obba rivulosa]
MVIWRFPDDIKDLDVLWCCPACLVGLLILNSIKLARLEAHRACLPYFHLTAHVVVSPVFFLSSVAAITWYSVRISLYKYTPLM